MKQTRKVQTQDIWLHNRPLEFYLLSDCFEFERMMVSPDFKYIVVIVEHSFYEEEQPEEQKSEESDQNYKLIIISTETHNCIHQDYCECFDYIDDYHYFSSDSRYFIYPKKKMTNLFDFKTKKLQNLDILFDNISVIHDQNIYYKKEDEFIIENIKNKSLQFYTLFTESRGIIIQPNYYVCREELLKIFDYRSKKVITSWNLQEMFEEEIFYTLKKRFFITKTMADDEYKTSLWLLPKGKLLRKIEDSGSQNICYTKEGKEEKIFYISDEHIFNIIRGTERALKLKIREENEKITPKLYLQLDSDLNLKYTMLEKII